MQARETIDRRVNELGVTEPNISRMATPAISSWCSCRASPTWRAPRRSSARPRSYSSSSSRRGPPGSQEALLQPVRRQGSERHGGHPAARRARAGRTSYYLVRKVAAVTGTDLRNAQPRIDENGQPAVLFSLTREGAREIRESNRREHRTPARDHPRQPRPVGAAHRDPHHRRRPDLRQLHPAGSRGPRARPELGRAAGQHELPRRARDRSDARRRLHSFRRHRVARRPRPGRPVHARVLQALGHQRDRRDAGQPDRSARADGVLRRGHDAARHRRLHPHDGHGRRLERADLRAHQGGARRSARRSRGRQRQLLARLPDAARHARHLAHRRRVPVPVRHRPDPRFRDDADRSVC